MDNDSPAEVMERLKPHAYPSYQPDPHFEEKMLMNAVLEAAGIYGEERTEIMYEVGKKFGIYESAPCEK